MAKVTATFLYSGMPDCWSGDGGRWEENKGCLFANYWIDTSMSALIETWVDDYMMGGDCDPTVKPAFDAISEEEIRRALVAMLSDEGKAAMESDDPCGLAEDFKDCNPDDGDWDGDAPVAIVLVEVTQCKS